MADEDSRLGRILERAIELTDKRQLDWTASPSREYGYVASLGAGLLFVGCVDDDGVGPFEFGVLKDPETEIGALTAGRYSPDIRAFYDVVHKRVHGLDTVLDDVERELGLE